jgi:hypothetical protein
LLSVAAYSQWDSALGSTGKTFLANPTWFSLNTPLSFSFIAVSGIITAVIFQNYLRHAGNGGKQSWKITGNAIEGFTLNSNSVVGE